MSRWFRFYAEVLNDPKVQKLDGDTFKDWINLLCVASMHGGKLPSMDDLAFAMRRSSHACSTLISRLLDAGLIDARQGGSHGVHYAPHGWDKRQFKSDTSTERVKRFRGVTRNVSETTPDTDTDTDTDTEKKEDASLRSASAPEACESAPLEKQKAKRETRATRLPEGFTPNDAGLDAAHAAGMNASVATTQLARFLDYHTAKGSKFVDWQAAWRTWCGNYRSFGMARAGPGHNPRPRTAHDAIADELRKYENEKPDHDHFDGITIDACPS